jgi:hypothetical protein
VARIRKVLAERTLQITLQEHLAEQSKKYSTEQFKSAIREKVRQFIGTNE